MQRKCARVGHDPIEPARPLIGRPRAARSRRPGLAWRLSSPRAGLPPGRRAGAGPAAPKVYRYHPKRRVPPSLESVQKYLAAGTDAFPEEKEAEELAGASAS